MSLVGLHGFNLTECVKIEFAILQKKSALKFSNPFSGDALATYQNNQSDRIDICDHKAPFSPNKRLWLSSGKPVNGLQACDVSGEALEKT